MTNITIRQMLEAGVHFGHKVCFWNPKMAPYIFTTKNNIHIIDLGKTVTMYEHGVNFLGSVAAKKGKILFVCTKQQARNLISDEAKRCNMPYVNFRWLGGMLTNYKTIRQSLKRLKELEDLRDSQTFARLTKKEALSVMRDITKLERSLGGIRDMGELPDAIFVIGVGHEKIAVSEASKLKIPIVGVVDTNDSPEGIDYIIPGNDDSIHAIMLYLQGVTNAIIDARSNIIKEEVLVEKDDKRNKEDKKLQHPVSKKKVFKKKTPIGDNEQYKESADKIAKEPKHKTSKNKQHVYVNKTTTVKVKKDTVKQVSEKGHKACRYAR